MFKKFLIEHNVKVIKYTTQKWGKIIKRKDAKNKLNLHD